jgi:hypothetical protein
MDSQPFTYEEESSHTDASTPHVPLSGEVAENILYSVSAFAPEHPEQIAQQKQIDKMTLELLVNKRQYRKYLEKTNTTEYAQKREHYSRFCKYKCAIAKLLDDLLNDYSISGNSAHLGNAELQDIFEAFVQKSTYFFVAKEQEILVSTNQISDDYESNTMFDRIDNETSATIANSPEPERAHELDDFMDFPYSDESGSVEVADGESSFSNTLYSASFVNKHYRSGKSFWGKNITKWGGGAPPYPLKK